MLHEIRWTAEKIARRLDLIAPLVYRRRVPLGPFYLRLLDTPADFQAVDAALDAAWDVVEASEYWGKPLAHFVLRGTFMVPRDWPADVPAALHLPLGDAHAFIHPEALVAVDGVTVGACDRYHPELDLAPWHDGRAHQLTLEGWIGKLDAEPGEKLRMGACEMVQIDAPTREFLALARVTLGTVRALDAADPARARLLTGLDAAFRALDTREPFGDAFYASVPLAHTLLGEHITESGPPLDVDVVAAGHAHIDVAWLWTLAVTRRKTQRAFRNVLRLMRDFPDFHFTQSQPQLYAFIRQDAPELFAAIRERVAEGRWEPIGGMWVEADCNISGGESLARQFLLGRAFFREHFGPRAEAPVLWLPDVFGYAWNLPQLIKQAGMDYFFTIKIGWNQYNRLPYDTFWWQGLDGTRVLTHFSTTPNPDSSAYGSTYSARATPEQMHGTWTSFKQKELPQPLLMCFGYGDGGGGPTREMLENLAQMTEFPALPRARQGKVGDFFRRVEAEVGDELPVWNGELYLEIHRGTYTTQARAKRANRQSEFLLHDAEFLAAMAATLAPEYAYPADAFRRAWELVCLNQFHDILPGSSIGPVYADAARQYAEVRALGEATRESALAVLAGQVGGDLLLVNPTAFPRRDLAHWPGPLAAEGLARADGTPVATQPTADGGSWLDAGELPPYSVTPLVATDAPAPERPPLLAAPNLLENAFLRVEFSAEGDITRIYDKGNAREVLPEGAIANQFLAFEDRPLNWDAWDIDIFYDDKVWYADPAQVIVDEVGPLRAALRVRRRILNSDIEQRIALSHDSPRLDFETVIHWRERHILLKVAFPVEVLAPMATYEIQWGNVTRPTHRNTSWDWARFETCAQKWVDLSEGGYGVSLLNDGKYGHDIHANVIRLSLLRSPTSPDPEADQGEQRVTYSLFPHAGGWDERTIAAAYALNDPLIVAPGSGAAARDLGSLLAVDAPHVVIETVKRAENGQGLILRLYESQRKRGPVTLTAGFPLARAWHANLLEQNQDALPVEGQTVRFEIKPYEIVTLRLVGA